MHSQTDDKEQNSFHDTYHILTWIISNTKMNYSDVILCDKYGKYDDFVVFCYVKLPTSLYGLVWISKYSLNNKFYHISWFGWFTIMCNPSDCLRKMMFSPNASILKSMSTTRLLTEFLIGQYHDFFKHLLWLFNIWQDTHFDQYAGKFSQGFKKKVYFMIS